MKILIAEDDSTSRIILVKMLERWGHETVEVSNGLEAFNILKNANAPRLALLDWMMPEMDGVEVCRALSAAGGRPPYIIILTARNNKDDVIEGLDSGANDYITKPYDIKELKARVNAGLRVLHLQDVIEQRVKEREEALAHVKTLQGLLPICMHCHKIRSDEDSWSRLEHYLSAHADVKFSHGICPDCMEKMYKD